MTRTHPDDRGDLSQHRPGELTLARLRDNRRRRPVSAVADMMGAGDEHLRELRRSLAGQRRTGRLLDGLGSGWRVLHAVPVGTRGSEIHHVVVGPPGVFTVDSRNNSTAAVRILGEQVMVGRADLDYADRCRAQAERATRLLGRALGRQVPVHGIVAVWARSLERSGSRPARAAAHARDPRPVVSVLAVEDLIPWLRAQTPRLRPAHVTGVFEVARDGATWSPAEHTGRRPA